MRSFAAGETVVRRDVFRGRVWSAHAFTVEEDTAEALVVGCGPGSESLAPTTWIASQHGGQREAREQALPSLAAGSWELGPWIWRRTAQLEWVPAGTWFSVNAFYEPDGEHRLRNWYVNFQRPMRRTAIGFDTFDLLLDLVVAPDLSRWSWKDEDEYDQGRRLGVVGDDDHRAVESAREEVLDMIERQAGPFAGNSRWRAWRSAPDRHARALPAGALDGVQAADVPADVPDGRADCT